MTKRRGHGRKLRHVHIKARLIKRGPKPTREEMLEVVDYILANGEAPDGWEYHGTDWARDSATGSGDINDLQNFRNILHAWRDSLQMAVVQVAG